MLDVIGTALLDYHKGNYKEDIKTFSSLEEEDVIPLPYLFRTYAEMPILEQKALNLATKSVLDIGCGAGSHSLYLQKKGLDVTALDSSEGAIQVCVERGILKTVQRSILDYTAIKFDTLLLLMNGIGIAGKLDNLGTYLNHFKTLLTPGGQILLDSSDIIYMFEQDDDGGYWTPGHVDYYGEVTFEMSYKNSKGAPFHWLYVDFKTLSHYAKKHNFNCELVSEGAHYDYLAKLTLI